MIRLYSITKYLDSWKVTRNVQAPKTWNIYMTCNKEYWELYTVTKKSDVWIETGKFGTGKCTKKHCDLKCKNGLWDFEMQEWSHRLVRMNSETCEMSEWTLRLVKFKNELRDLWNVRMNSETCKCLNEFCYLWNVWMNYESCEMYEWILRLVKCLDELWDL